MSEFADLGALELRLAQHREGLLLAPAGPESRPTGGQRHGHAVVGREHEEHGRDRVIEVLVHVTYARLVGNLDIRWQDRAHFYEAAAEAMRRVLIDHVRRVGSQKRGGDRMRVTLGSPESPVEFDVHTLLALGEALAILAEEDPRASEVTRLRFSAGLTVEETAPAMNLSERSLAREWAFAKARLMDLLGAD